MTLRASEPLAVQPTSRRRYGMFALNKKGRLAAALHMANRG